MTFILADRVRETSTTTGTGTYTLAGAVSNFSAFSNRMANNDTCYYHAIDTGGSGWEVGIGTWATGGTLARTTILSSSNSDAAVNWSAGTRNISIGLPAGKALVVERSNQLFDISDGVPASSSFTWGNQSSSTLTETSGKAITLEAGSMGTTDNFAIRYVAVPSTPYTLTALIMGRVDLNSFGKMAVGWFDGTKLHFIGLSGINSSLSNQNLSVTRFSNYTTFVSHDATSFPQANGLAFFQLADDGTNVSFRVSYDGVRFEQVYGVAKASGYLGSSGYSNLFWGNAQRGASGSPAQKTTLRLWTFNSREFR